MGDKKREIIGVWGEEEEKKRMIRQLIASRRHGIKGCV